MFHKNKFFLHQQTRPRTHPALTRLFLFILTALLLLFTVLDAAAWWLRFGPMAHPAPDWLAETSAVLRALRTGGCVGLVLLGASARHSDRDFGLLVAAFAFILIGDFFIIVQQRLLLGIAAFGLVQGLLIVRHGRGLRNYWRSAMAAQRRALARLVGGIYLGSGLLLLTLMRPLAATGLLGAVAGYALLLSTALWTAWATRWTGTLPPRNARLAAWGLTLFVACDVTIGLGAAFPGTALGVGALVTTGLFYTPALVLLALSGRAD